MIYLATMLWPYMLGALLIGFATGFFALARAGAPRP